VADNVPITAGVGTDIATDQITTTGEHVQLFKLAISTDGSRTLVPANVTWGLDVEVTRVVPVTAYKAAQYTSAQTGTAIWTPASGKSVVVTSLQIQSYGTTAGTAIVWFGASGDTTYTRNTDGALFDGEFVPTATNKPGVYVAYPTPMQGTADYVLRLTTTGAQSITVNVWGYEV
jgi:hypothetical protein